MEGFDVGSFIMALIQQAPVLGAGLAVIWMLHREAIKTIKLIGKILVMVVREFRAVKRSLDANTIANGHEPPNGDDDNDRDLELLLSELEGAKGVTLSVG